MTDMTKGTNQHYTPKKRGFFSTLASQWQLALMSVPIFLYVILFNYVPMWGWTNAFKDYGNRKLVARASRPGTGWKTSNGCSAGRTSTRPSATRWP